MNTIENFNYLGALYTWLHEPQNLYEATHITIQDVIQVINRNDSVLIEQDFIPPRYKHIGLSPAGIIVVITDESFTRIITAWHASATEVKTWLAAQ